MTKQTATVCPHCHDTAGHPVESTNLVATVDYFRCAQCGHVWTQPKPGHDGRRHDVSTYQSDQQPHG